MALLVGCNLVFYVQLADGTRFVWRNYVVNFGGGGGGGENLVDCRYFVFKQEAGKVTLTESLLNLDNTCSPFFARPESLTLVEKKNRRSPILWALLECCGLDPRLSSKLEPLTNLNHLSLLAPTLFDIYKEKIVVVDFKGAKGSAPTSRTRQRNFVPPAKCVFQLLALVAPPSHLSSVTALDPETLKLFACSFSGGSRFALLTEPYAEQVKKLLYAQPNEDVTRDRVDTLEVGAGGPKLFDQPAEEREKSRSSKLAAKKSRCPGNRVRKQCTCQSCAHSKAYDANMSRGGPEKLLTHKLTLNQLVRILGAQSAETSSILEQLSRLSVAAFDIESMTVALDHINSRIAPLADIDTATRSQHALAVQKPIMLAHRDALMHAQDPCQVFVLESNDEASVYKLVRDYWKFVTMRRSRVKKLKELLAAPLLGLCNKYKKAYLDYAQAWRDPENEEKRLELQHIVSGWRQSLPGKLESQLKRLIGAYEIFSFYGSGYDHILLQAYLVPYLFEKGLRPKLEKSGNKISAIRVTKLGVSFRDVVKLLAPGTSLRQFGKLFKLTQEKAHFPFALLTGVEALDLPGLPRDVADWHSDLSVTGKGQTTQTEVDESLKLFEQSGCHCLGDYLRTYLQLDVDILYSATQGWRQTMAQEIGVDFVQTGNYTISSVSNLAGDQRTAANLQVGQFFPNNSAVYRLLRKGMRG